MDRVKADEILTNLQTKFRALNQVYDLTRELDEAFAKGDANSLDMLLDMRMRQIQVCLDMNDKNQEIFLNLGEQGEELAELIKGKKIIEFPDEETKEIYNIAERINVVLDKTKELDQIVMNKLDNMM